MVNEPHDPVEPWGQLKGSVWDYDTLVTNQAVYVNLASTSWPQSLHVSFSTNTDAAGAIRFGLCASRQIFGLSNDSGLTMEPVRDRKKLFGFNRGRTSTVKIGGSAVR